MDFSKKRKTDVNGDANSSPPSTDATVTTTTLTSDDIRKILQPFTHDQLLDLLQSASLQHPDVLDAVRSVADRDTAQRKLFVRGLSAETTTDTLRTVFSSYGDIDEAIVIFDKSTGRSKGYGFVVFQHVDSAILALKEPSKKIDGRMTVTQLAAAGSGSTGGSDVSTRKIFVGNIPFEVSAESLLSEFLKYGEVEEGPLGFDKTSGKTRGFAFFVYKTEEGAKASLLEPLKTIDGHQVICKMATDNKKPKPGTQNPSGYPVDNSGSNLHAPNAMMMPQYGAPPNSYGQPYSNQVPSAGGYGPGIGAGASHYGGPVAGPGHVSGPRAPPASVGGYPDGSHYGYPSQPMPVQRPPPGGMYQGVPPYY